MAKKPTESSGDDFFESTGSWSSIVEPTTSNERDDNDSFNPNDTSDATLNKIIKQALDTSTPKAKPAPKKAAIVEEEDVEDNSDDDFDLNDFPSEEAEVEEDLGEPSEDEEVLEDELEVDESEDEDSEVVAEEPKKKNRVEERFKKYTEQLKAKDQELLKRDMALAEAEAQAEAVKRDYETKIHRLATSFAESSVKSAEQEYESAKAKYRMAREMGDTEAEVDATDLMAESKAKLNEAKRIQQSIPKAEDLPKPPTAQDVYARKRALTWIKSNEQILSSDVVKRAVNHVDNLLAQEGYQASDEDYIPALNERVNKILVKNGIKTTLVNPFHSGELRLTDEAPKKAKQVAKKGINPMGGVQTGLAPKRKVSPLSRLDQKERAEASRLNINQTNLLAQKAITSKYAPTKGQFSPIFVPKKK